MLFSEFMQKQLPEVFYKKGVLRNFAKFTGKHLCQSLFFNKVASGLRLQASGFIDNLQPNNSNVKLLQCYGIFLTSLNLTFTKVKTHLNPVMTQHVRDQEILYTLSLRWGRNPGLASSYVKTQD